MADRRRNLGIPSGVVFPFAGTAAPYGYLICDGRVISRADYPVLFLAIGTAHGQGDGVTTFNLPDYRGRFMRGVDGLAGNDPDKASRTAMAAGGNTGNTVGSIQADELRTHTHSVLRYNDIHGVDPGGSYWRGVITTQSGATGGGETRPKNANVNYIIKV